MIAQVTSLVKQIAGGYVMSSTFIGIMIVFTMIFYYYFSKPILSPEKFPEEEIQLRRNMVEEWKAHYTHPLILSSSHYKISKENQSSFAGVSFAGGSFFGFSPMNKNSPKEFNGYRKLEEIDDEPSFELQHL